MWNELLNDYPDNIYRKSGFFLLNNPMARNSHIKVNKWGIWNSNLVYAYIMQCVYNMI